MINQILEQFGMRFQDIVRHKKDIDVRILSPRSMRFVWMPLSLKIHLTFQLFWVSLQLHRPLLLLFLYHLKTRINSKFINEVRRLPLIPTTYPLVSQLLLLKCLSFLQLFEKVVVLVPRIIQLKYFLSHLFPTYFCFTTTLSFISLLKSYRDAMLDPG